ncbi:helix-turn-helix domain-containing protein [Streptomyces sp. ITFR-6]|uniref:helix-turn-helix domain-containing protein n=1 Tax=Streptomyces sp. ITFR-6 TaxID=3075197 RepID=UPI00288AB614|nr:helix-turn-helix domain-containing protein [Streptomyces sp. ITFR-6]WNI34190.1 helix-turn-helix domain-containing protein [Streptomyces sp. ITFR-6]
MLPGATWDKGIDLVAVERAALCRGACPALTDEEKRRTVLVMTEAGRSAEDIAARLGMAERTVGRWRGEMGLSS